MQQLPELPQPPQPPQPPQLAGPARIVQVPKTAGPSGDLATMELIQLRAHADALKLRVSDLEMQVGQIAEARSNVSPAERQQFAKPLADANHELASARIQLEATQKQISELETARDMARVGITIAPPPRRDDFSMERERMIGAASFILLLPLVLAWSRRIWHRGGPRPSVDLEDSPRLQRMEQAIESIAMEVEAIAEAQRFTTRILAERHPDSPSRAQAAQLQQSDSIAPR